MLEQDDTDLIKICNHYEVNVDRLTKDVSVALDRLKSGNSRTPGLSDRIPRWIQDAWLLASVDFGSARVRSGHLTLALMANESFARIAREISKEFDHISAESLQTKLPEITADSAEERDAVALGETAGVSAAHRSLPEFPEKQRRSINTPKILQERRVPARSIRSLAAISRYGRSWIF